MKINFLKTFLILITVFSIFILQSCKDPCKDVACVNGACVDGFCLCADGYTGTDCSIPPDPCLSISCNNAVCVDGTCICDDGYDGTDCNILIRSLFIGTYTVEEICDSDVSFTDNYASKISESAQGLQYITIDNIYNFASQGTQPEDATVLASVSNSGGEYIVLIDTQTFSAPVLSTLQVSGSGTYNPATAEITMTYSIVDTSLSPTDPGYTDNCIQIYTP